MQRWISFLAGLIMLTTPLFVPARAEAQCLWGCSCVGSACGCNQRGNGGKCDATATGCIVSQCNEARLYFAPDGSVLRLALGEDDPGAERTEAFAEQHETQLGGTTRWEAAGDRRSVARHCSGVVVARFYAAEEAAAIREALRTLTL